MFRPKYKYRAICSGLLLAALLPITALAESTADQGLDVDERNADRIDNIIVHGQRPVQEATLDQNDAFEAAIENSMNSEALRQYAHQAIAESLQRLRDRVELYNGDILKDKQATSFEVN